MCRAIASRALHAFVDCLALCHDPGQSRRCNRVAAFLIIGIKQDRVASFVRHGSHWVLQQASQIIHCQTGLLADPGEGFGHQNLTSL